METGRQSRNYALCIGMALAFWVVQTVYMHGTLLHVGSAGESMALSALFALVYGGALGGFCMAAKAWQAFTLGRRRVHGDCDAGACEHARLCYR